MAFDALFLPSERSLERGAVSRIGFPALKIQLAGSAEVNDLVMRLLESLPPRAHVVIITRTDPALHLAKLRGQGELVEIRESDLALHPRGVQRISRRSERDYPGERGG